MVVYGSTTVRVLYTVYRDVLLAHYYYCYYCYSMQHSNAIASTRVTTTLLAIDTRARVAAIDRSTTTPQDRGYSRSILCGGIW